MSFIRYVARKLVGLPPSDGLEVVEAMRYSSPIFDSIIKVVFLNLLMI